MVALFDMRNFYAETFLGHMYIIMCYFMKRADSWTKDSSFVALIMLFDQYLFFHWRYYEGQMTLFADDDKETEEPEVKITEAAEKVQIYNYIYATVHFYVFIKKVQNNMKQHKFAKKL